jgi:hypothetical protein
MKLFTKDIDKKLFAQFDLGGDLENQKVIAKIFNPYGRGTWYIINSDPSDPDYLWAIVDLFEVETGSVSRSELETIKVPPFGLHLEKDSGFTPINAAELYKGLVAGKRYNVGGTTEQSENKEMILNQAEELEHHVEELEEAAKKSDHVPAWIVAKVERASTDLSDASHYLDAENEQKREEMEGEEEYEKGGEIKWQDAQIGDSALVVSENKMGMIVKDYGRKFHLRFLRDGTEKTYDASELRFFGDIDDFDMGGKMASGGMTDPMATVNEIAKLSGVRPIAIAEWGDKNNINLTFVLKDLKSKKIKGMDIMTAIVGNPNNKYQKELSAKYSKMAMGGKVKFADKVKSIKKSLLERKKVSPKVQKDYGKTYSPNEAEESAKRIVGAQTARERLMMRIKSKKKK